MMRFLLVPFLLLALIACGSKDKSPEVASAANNGKSNGTTNTVDAEAIAKRTEKEFLEMAARTEGMQEWVLSNSIAPASLRQVGANLQDVEVLVFPSKQFQVRIWELTPGTSNRVKEEIIDGTWKIEVVGNEGRLVLGDVGYATIATHFNERGATLTMPGKAYPMAYLKRTRDCCRGQN